MRVEGVWGGEGLGVRVQGSWHHGQRVEGLELRAFGFRVQGLDLRIYSVWYRVRV